MQAVLKVLDLASRETGAQRLSHCADALRIFEYCMQGLAFHVSIEERRLFPMLQREYPSVDVSFLYEDHKHLHKLEDSLKKTLRACAKKDGSSLDAAISSALEFDACLLQHLGEEEEIVVPMMLEWTAWQ